jgi:hypothetical protein
MGPMPKLMREAKLPCFVTLAEFLLPDELPRSAVVRNLALGTTQQLETGESLLASGRPWLVLGAPPPLPERRGSLYVGHHSLGLFRFLGALSRRKNKMELRRGLCVHSPWRCFLFSTSGRHAERKSARQPLRRPHHYILALRKMKKRLFGRQGKSCGLRHRIFPHFGHGGFEPPWRVMNFAPEEAALTTSGV